MAGTVTPPTGPDVRRWDYPATGDQAVVLQKGDEMGHFKLGSTVINLFPKGMIHFVDDMQPEQPTRMGEPYAKLNAQEQKK